MYAINHTGNAFYIVHYRNRRNNHRLSRKHGNQDIVCNSGRYTVNNVIKRSRNSAPKCFDNFAEVKNRWLKAHIYLVMRSEVPWQAAFISARNIP